MGAPKDTENSLDSQNYHCRISYEQNEPLYRRMKKKKTEILNVLINKQKWKTSVIQCDTINTV